LGPFYYGQTKWFVEVGLESAAGKMTLESSFETFLVINATIFLFDLS
jgi:hypothetical protein